jgi:hypothetical protein
MNKVRKQVNNAKSKGLSQMEIAYMREIARKEAEKIESVALEKSFLYMLAIPMNVLVNDYWQKSAKQRIPKFIEEVMSLYESVQAGVVTDQELANLLYELSGVKIEAEWLK